MRSLRCPQRVGAICLRQLGIHIVEGGEVGGYRSSVTAGHRPGERALPTLQGVLQCSPGQRADDPLGKPPG